MRRPGHVAGPHDGRVDELVDRVLGHEHLRVLQHDLDAVFRHDVGDAGGEDVRPLLLEQRGPLAFALGRLVLRPRVLSLRNARLDGTRTDVHAHGVDRRPRRRRKDVDRLDGLAAIVREDLVDHDTRDGARDGDLGARLLERQAVALGVAARHEEVGCEGPLSAMARVGERAFDSGRPRA